MNSIIPRVAVAALFAMTVTLANAKDEKLMLSGDQENPAVTTKATGEGHIKVADDKTVTGKVKTKGIEGTMGHIHEGKAPGENGPPIITLEKGSDGAWDVPKGSKLTDEQYEAFKAGKLYVNIHSAEHKGGEIRAPLKP